MIIEKSKTKVATNQFMIAGKVVCLQSNKPIEIEMNPYEVIANTEEELKAAIIKGINTGVEAGVEKILEIDGGSIRQRWNDGYYERVGEFSWNGKVTLDLNDPVFRGENGK